MADKPVTPRTFTKKLPDGTTQTRSVTSPQAEVQALYDGFAEDAASAKSGGSSRSSAASSSS